MKAVIDNKIPFIHGAVEHIVDEAIYLPGDSIGRDDVGDADVLIVRTRTRCDRALLEGSRVKFVITATIGFDHIDTRYLSEAGIRWTNCPGCNAPSVRQYVHNVLLVLHLATRPLTAAVVGAGHVGSLVAEDLARQGMHVLICDPPLQQSAATGLTVGAPFFRLSEAVRRQMPFVPLAEVAERADLITFHTPLTNDGPYPTHHLADTAFFHSLRRQPVLINTSRGAVVDNVALLHALETGQVSDAVIDTWEHEPDILPALLERAVIATPHIAGYSADGKANATRMSLRALCAFLGRPFTLRIQPPALPDGYRYGSLASEGPLRLYDPRADSMRLKAAPQLFESLRGNYPLRREHE